MTPSEGSCGVEGVLYNRGASPGLVTTRSVKVPPTSIPILNMFSPCPACWISGYYYPSARFVQSTTTSLDSRMKPQQPTKEAAWHKLVDYILGYQATWITNIGLKAGLFKAVSEAGPPGTTEDALAETLGFSPRYVGIWCRAAYAFEMLDWNEASGLPTRTPHGLPPPESHRPPLPRRQNPVQRRTPPGLSRFPQVPPLRRHMGPEASMTPGSSKPSRI